ncbi:MAG: metal ABC transporter ATP-binding protein [Patescibacteria group bacterium]
MSVNCKNIIELHNVSFSYGQTLVLKNITLNICHGDYLGMIGPNGSGKTTLLKVMLGLLKPSAGEVKLFDKPINKFRDWSKLGYVPQKAINFDPLFPATVWEITAMGRYGKKGLLRGLDKKDDAIIAKALRQVEMLEYKDRLIGDLSAGQEQRVFIARALSGEPEILFLDEPTVGVDVKNQEEFYALLKNLNKQLGLTLIFVSHDLDVVTHEATKLACVNQSLIYHGEPKQFIKGDYLQKLYGENVRLILHDH